MSVISVPVSYGELIDKITILEIKSERMSDEQKLTAVRHELRLLENAWRHASADLADIGDARSRLKSDRKSVV